MLLDLQSLKEPIYYPWNPSSNQIKIKIKNKYDFKSSSIIDLNLGSLIFLGGEGYRAMGYSHYVFGFFPNTTEINHCYFAFSCLTIDIFTNVVELLLSLNWKPV